MDREVHSSHDQHAGHSAEMFRQRFWWTLLLSIPTFVWAPMVQHWFGYHAFGGLIGVALDLRSVLMTLSTIIVAANAQLLRRVQL